MPAVGGEKQEQGAQSSHIEGCSSEPEVVACTCHPSTWEGEAGGPGVQLQTEFEARLGYMKPCLQDKASPVEEWLLVNKSVVSTLRLSLVVQ